MNRNAANMYVKSGESYLVWKLSPPLSLGETDAEPPRSHDVARVCGWTVQRSLTTLRVVEEVEGVQGVEGVEGVEGR